MTPAAGTVAPTTDLTTLYSRIGFQVRMSNNASRALTNANTDYVVPNSVSSYASGGPTVNTAATPGGGIPAYSVRPGVAGWWLLTARVYFFGSSGNYRNEVWVGVRGETPPIAPLIGSHIAGGLDWHMPSGFVVMQLAATDDLTLYAKSTLAGMTIYQEASADVTYQHFTGVFLGQ